MMLLSNYLAGLELYKETPQFRLYCAPLCRADAQDMLFCLEQYMHKISADFNHIYSETINVYIYPDLACLHRSIGWPDAPDWVIGSYDHHSMHTVCLCNPGPVHTRETVMVSRHVGLITLFIRDLYPHHAVIPRWLHQGVGLYKAGYFSKESIIKLKDHLPNLPTLEQLEKIDKSDGAAFNALNGFLVSYALVGFIDQRWGWSVIRQLLQDYDKFEQILGMNKQQFRQQWLHFVEGYNR